MGSTLLLPPRSKFYFEDSNKGGPKCGPSNKQRWRSHPRFRHCQPQLQSFRLINPLLPANSVAPHLAVARASAPASRSRGRSPASKTCRLTASSKGPSASKVMNSWSAPTRNSLPKFMQATWWPSEKSWAMSTRAAASTLRRTVPSPATLLPRASASKTALISRAASKSTRPELLPPPINYGVRFTLRGVEGPLVYPEVRTAAAFSCSGEDRKSTRLNSSHVEISYAVFCLKKKKKTHSLMLLL